MRIAVLEMLICCFLILEGYSYTIRGTVYEGKEQVSMNTEVWLVHSGKGVLRQCSDEYGKFVFSNLPIGEVSVVARNKQGKLGGNTFVCADDQDIQLYLFKGVVQKIRVLNPNLVPVSGAFIRRLWVADAFCFPAEELAEAGMGWLRSNDDGIIYLENMPNKNFIRIIVSHIEYADTYLPFVPISENSTMDIIMKRGSIVRGRTTKDGKGVEGAWVVVAQKGVGTDLPIMPSKTDKEGFYRMRLGKGEYRLFAIHPDFPNTPPKEISISEPDGEVTVDFTFNESLVVEGTILLPEGTPCKLAKVVLTEPSGMEDFVFTDDSGKYVLKLNSEKAKMKIVPPPGYMTEILPEISIDFKGMKKINADPVRLKSLPKFTGTIKLPDGSNAERVIITTRNLEFPIYALTNDQGYFQIQLGYMPEVETIDLVAEHGLRFLRNEFRFNIFEKNDNVEISLFPFEPNQKKFINVDVKNKMAHLLDKSAPPIRCRSWFNYDGEKDKDILQNFTGRVVILLFWGGFDNTPFALMHLEEMRALFDLYHGVSDVMILSVHDGMMSDEEVEKFVQAYSVNFPVGIDTDSGDTFKNYSIEFIPQVVLIDKRGILRYTDVTGRIVELIKVLRRTQ